MDISDRPKEKQIYNISAQKQKLAQENCSKDKTYDRILADTLQKI